MSLYFWFFYYFIFFLGLKPYISRHFIDIYVFYFLQIFPHIVFIFLPYIFYFITY